MKILNKVLSLVICISLCMGCAAFAADSEGGFEPAEYNEAVLMLKDLGIIDSTEYANYDASVVMTRGEFAALSLDILGLRNDAKATAFNQKYTDVVSTDTYAKEINFATALGLFSGVSKTEFSPDTPIYIEQAIKVAVNMAGYGAIAEAKGGYPTGYLTIANSIKITDGVKLDNKSGALRGNVIVLMYNTLFADMVKIDGVSDDGLDYNVTKDENILSEYHDITEAEGIVTANHLFAVSGKTTEEGYIAIDGVTYYTESSRASDYVGKNVKYYYKKINGKNTVLTMREENTETVVIKANDEYTFDSKKKAYTLEGSNKTYSFKLDSDFDLVYNMSLVDGNGVVDYEKLLTPSIGTITLIDNDDDSVYEIVIIDEGKIVIFNSYDSYKNKIYDKKLRTYDINLDDYNTVSISGDDGLTLEASDIKADNILTVYESIDKNAIRIIVSTTTKSGRVTEKDNEDKVYIGSNEYVYSPSARVDNYIKVGSSYKLYFNCYNEIVYYESSSDKSTGYILKSGKTGDGISSTYSAEIIAGDVLTLDFADNVKIETIDGKKQYKAENVSDALKDAANKIYPTGINTEGRLFVQYETNKDNKITSITVPYVISTKEEYDNPPSNYGFFKLDYMMTAGASIGSFLSYTPENKSAGMWMLFDSNCQIYYVPEFADIHYSKDKFSAASLDTIKRDDKIYFTKTFTGISDQLEAYSTDSELSFVNDIVWVSKNGNASDVKDGYDNNMLVTSVSSSLSDAGDDLIKITGFMNKKEVELYSDDESVITADSMKTVPIDGTLPVISDAKKELKAGDIIKYGVGADGYVDKIALVYDAEINDICYKSTSFTRYTDQYRYTCGTVEDIRGGYLFMNLHDNSLTEFVKEPHLASAFKRVYVYDLDRDEAHIGSASEASIGDYVFVCDNYRNPTELIIFKGGK